VRARQPASLTAGSSGTSSTDSHETSAKAQANPNPATGCLDLSLCSRTRIKVIGQARASAGNDTAAMSVRLCPFLHAVVMT
jgi:hypothetical protein